MADEPTKSGHGGFGAKPASSNLFADPSASQAGGGFGSARADPSANQAGGGFGSARADPSANQAGGGFGAAAGQGPFTTQSPNTCNPFVTRSQHEGVDSNPFAAARASQGSGFGTAAAQDPVATQAPDQGGGARRSNPFGGGFASVSAGSRSSGPFAAPAPNQGGGLFGESRGGRGFAANDDPFAAQAATSSSRRNPFGPQAPAARGPRSIPFGDMAAGDTYACAVAPFIAECTQDPAHSDTVTLRVPGRGEVALPKWFVEDLVTAVKPELDPARHDGEGAITVFIPSAPLDEHQPLFAAPKSVCPQGWTDADSFDLKGRPEPPALVGSAQERHAVAACDAGLVLRDSGAVPHAVVPKLVLAHVVGPFAKRIKCTVVEAFMGVTEVDGSSISLPLSDLPNVTTLSLNSVPESPIPPHTTSLTIRRSHTSMPRVLAGMPLCVDSADGLVELTLGVEVTALSLQGVPPIPTLKKLTLGKLFVGDSVSQRTAFLYAVAVVTPNVEALAFEKAVEDDTESVEVALFFFEHRESMWPSATSLKISGLWPAIAIMANARPWRALSLGWRRKTSPFSSSASTSGLAEDVGQRIVQGSHLTAGVPAGGTAFSTLEDLTIYDTDVTVTGKEGPLSMLPAVVIRGVKSLTFRQESVSFEKDSNEPLRGVFAQAENLTHLQLRDVDFGTGFGASGRSAFSTSKPTLPSPAEVAAAFAFCPSLQSVKASSWSTRWSRAVKDAGLWCSTSWETPSVGFARAKPALKTRSPQILLWEPSGM